MRNEILIIVLLFTLFCGCSTTKKSAEKNMKHLWEFIPNTSPVDKGVNIASFKLDKKSFIDSFVHFEAKTRGQNPEIKLLMPLPNIDGLTDEYYFKPIYDFGPKADTVTLGFIGENKSNKRDISSLYIRNNKIVIKWSDPSKNWVLKPAGRDSSNSVYHLIDLSSAKDEPKLAPLPKYTY